MIGRQSVCASGNLFFFIVRYDLNTHTCGRTFQIYDNEPLIYPLSSLSVSEVVLVTDEQEVNTILCSCFSFIPCEKRRDCARAEARGFYEYETRPRPRFDQ